MRVLVLVLAVIFTGVLTTAATLFGAPQPATHVVRAHAMGDEIRARVHASHASHLTALDQDDDFDDDCSGDDDVNAPGDPEPQLVGSAPPSREIPPPSALDDGLGPAVGHRTLLDHPPRTAAS